MCHACLRGSGVYVLACRCGLRTNLPTCQKCANFSLCINVLINVPHGMLMFQLDVPTCQKACQFFKYFSYEMLRKISVREISILYYIICICIVHENCIILHFYASCHIKEKCLECFFSSRDLNRGCCLRKIFSCT